MIFPLEDTLLPCWHSERIAYSMVSTSTNLIGCNSAKKFTTNG